MGRLDDIVARNKGSGSGGGGLLGAFSAELNDPTATPDDVKRRALAMGIVLVAVVVIGLLVYFLA